MNVIIEDFYKSRNIREYRKYAPTLRADRSGLKVIHNIEKGDCMENKEGLYIEISPELKVYAVWYPKEECYVAIRKLTPKECFRLQGWTDDYFEKAQFVNSDSQLYKQSGNGVTVNVIHEIAKQLI